MQATGAGTTLREEAQSCQWLSFYQRELALYTFAHLDQPTSDYCADRDLHPIMKGAHLCPCFFQNSQMLLTGGQAPANHSRFLRAWRWRGYAEHWCKKAPPSQEMLATYKAQAPIPATLPPPPPPPDRAKVWSMDESLP